MTPAEAEEVERDPYRPVLMTLHPADAHLVAWALTGLAAVLQESPRMGAKGDSTRAVEIACELRAELVARGLVQRSVE